MKIREFLQIEIWSKRTSRKILAVIGVLAVGFIALYLFESRWLSRSERKAGREALAAIEKLKPLAGETDEQYRIADSHAKEKVELAQRLGWTALDRNVTTLLYVELLFAEFEHEDPASAGRTANFSNGQRRVDKILHQLLD